MIRVLLRQKLRYLCQLGEEDMMEIKLNKRLQRRPRWLIILVIIIVLGGFIGIKTLNQQYLPVDSNNKEPVEIYIPAESSARQIAAILYENKLIRSQNAFYPTAVNRDWTPS